MLVKPTKSTSRKGQFPYTNLITCGVCGCSLTAEIKKGKYIYYHCTGYKGNCKQPYIRQEVIEQRFEELLQSIHISDEIQALILKGLKDSFKDKIEYHNNLVKTLERQIKVLQSRIDQIYKVEEDFWQLHSKKWQEEKDELMIKLASVQRADSSFLKDVNIILELSKQAATLFKKQNASEKRQLLKMILSNCSYRDGELDIQLKKPFAMIMQSAQTRKWCARS